MVAANPRLQVNLIHVYDRTQDNWNDKKLDAQQAYLDWKFKMHVRLGRAIWWVSLVCGCYGLAAATYLLVIAAPPMNNYGAAAIGAGAGLATIGLGRLFRYVLANE